MKEFPFYRQLDSMDCGPSCLYMIAKWYGKVIPIETIRKKSYITNSGVTLLGLSDAAEAMRMRSGGYRLSWEQLLTIDLPVIAFWHGNHFVVIYKIKKVKNNRYNVYVSDPATGRLVYSQETFLNFWHSTEKEGEKQGYVLTVEPTPQFYNSEYPSQGSVRFSYLLEYFRPYKKYIIQLLIGILTGSCISLIFPFLTQAIVDYGIGNNNLSFIVVVLIAQLFLSVGQTANNLIRSWIILHMTTRISIALISNFLMKLMLLPISFFDIKLTGDIIQRIEDHGRIQQFLTGTLFSMLFAIITFIIYTLVMSGYHLGILAVFISGSMLYIIWVLLFLKKRRDLDYLRFQEAAANQSTMIQLITGMQEIKLSACEKQKRWEWEKIQVRLFRINIKQMTLSQTQQVGGFFINQSKNIIVSFIAAKAVIDGNMSLGTMMAIQYILGQLNSPIEQFIAFAKEAQDAKISLERLGEIHQKEDEELEEQHKIKKILSARAIDIKNVTFQYGGPRSPVILDNISFSIPAKKTTAIVGMSGSGKTTLIKLLLGYYQPISGEILLDGVGLDSYSPREWRKTCGVVMQEGFIFSDTIMHNIGIIDDTPDKEHVEYAARIANISTFIGSLPSGYETKIGNDGHGLSSGQKQRILIARSIYKNPRYIFLDEATNSLDADNEKQIIENLNHFFEGKTVVVVAHRLSTVKNADQIIVLDNGRIAEQGNHEQLIHLRGKYYNLVKNQLELDM